MALTRKFLTALGIEADKIDEIITAHSETVDGLKSERDKYKGDAEKLPNVQKELDDLKAADNSGWKEKHDKLAGEFEDYKHEVEAKELRAAKEKAYRDILKDANLNEKGIEKAIKYAEWDNIKIDADGKLEGANDHINAVKTEWAEYVTTTKKQGANTNTPPANGGSGTGKTRDEILAIKDGALRRAEMAKNPHLFGLDVE